MTQTDPIHDWLSLNEATTMLGVAASTVRRWGDAGLVPITRTLGGHRRFQRAAIERMIAQQHPPAPSVPDLSSTRHWSVDTRALLDQDWHHHFDPANPATERMRGLGQRLFGMLMQYINAHEPEPRLLEAAQSIGATYGAEARVLGISLRDTVEAFLFFRRAFTQLAKPTSARPVDVAMIVDVRSRLDMFMDATLLGTIDGYTATP